MLSTGDSFQTVGFSFRVGFKTVGNIVREVCDAIWEELSPKYLKVPDKTEWEKIRTDFWKVWNVPNCIGSIDGKHCTIQAPSNSGTDYFNYKKFFSIILLAVVDANYCFTVIDVGATGRQSDGGVLGNTCFFKKLEANELHLPDSKSLPNTSISLPNYFLGDEAFPLKTFLMRPYGGKLLSEPKKVYNYRHSRGRRVVENAFGILSSKWRIFR